MKRRFLSLACLLNFNIILAQPSFEKIGKLNVLHFYVGFFAIAFSFAVIATLLQKEKRNGKQ